MKICLVGLAYPFRGGIAHYTTMLYRALQDRHSVLLVTFRRQYPKIFFPGSSQYDPAARDMKVDDRPLIDSLNPLSWVTASRAIHRFRPDMTIIQWWMPFFGPCVGTMSMLLRLMGQKRVCCLCHNVRPHQRKPLDRVFTFYGLRFAERFIVHSDEDLANLLRMRKGVLARKNPHPTYGFFAQSGAPGREESRTTLGLDGPVILFFGFVKAYKGLMDLIHAMPEIRNRTGATLLIVGEFYDDKRPYLEAVDRLRIGEAVRIVDRYVPNEEVPLYFAASDLVVLPYRSATQSGIAQIALAMGLPCVVTRVGGLPEVITDGITGYTVAPGDPEGLAQAVVRFFEEGGPERFREGIEREAWKFSWERMVELIEELARA